MVRSSFTNPPAMASPSVRPSITPAPRAQRRSERRNLALKMLGDVPSTSTWPPVEQEDGVVGPEISHSPLPAASATESRGGLSVPASIPSERTRRCETCIKDRRKVCSCDPRIVSTANGSGVVCLLSCRQGWRNLRKMSSQSLRVHCYRLWIAFQATEA
jgi:hypothetical protein